MYEALETGFNIASGKYFYWLNSDDYLLDENSVQRLMDILNEKDFEWLYVKLLFQNLMLNRKFISL